MTIVFTWPFTPACFDHLGVFIHRIQFEISIQMTVTVIAFALFGHDAHEPKNLTIIKKKKSMQALGDALMQALGDTLFDAGGRKP